MTHIFRITSVSLLDPCLLKKLPEKKMIYSICPETLWTKTVSIGTQAVLPDIALEEERFVCCFLKDDYHFQLRSRGK